MKSRAILTVRLLDPGVRAKLSSVMAPDNEGLPRGLRLSMTARGAAITCVVESASPSTAVSTILALLRDVSLFQEVWLLSHVKHGAVRRD